MVLICGLLHTNTSESSIQSVRFRDLNGNHPCWQGVLGPMGASTIRCGAGKEMSQETRRLFQGEAPPSDFSVLTWPALNIQRFFLFYMSNITPIISTEPHKGICRVFFASHMEQHFFTVSC